MGPTSFYRLTYPEMRDLYRGFEVAQEQAEMRAKGVSHGDQKAFSEFASDMNSGDWHRKHNPAVEGARG